MYVQVQIFTCTAPFQGSKYRLCGVCSLPVFLKYIGLDYELFLHL